MNGREIALFAPLVVQALLMGLYPEPFLNVMHVSVATLINQYDTAIQSAANRPLQVAAE